MSKTLHVSFYLDEISNGYLVRGDILASRKDRFFLSKEAAVRWLYKRLCEKVGVKP